MLLLALPLCTASVVANWNAFGNVLQLTGQETRNPVQIPHRKANGPLRIIQCRVFREALLNLEMEWVYDGHDDEPIVFEGSGEITANGISHSDVYDSPAKGFTKTDSSEYYGDQVDEHLLSPEECFAHIAKLTLGHDLDVDDSQGKAIRSRAKVIASETREERIRRIREEIEELAAIDGYGDAVGYNANVLSKFREQLSIIERYSVSLRRGCAPATQVAVEGTTTDSMGENANSPSSPRREAGRDGLVLKVFAPNLSSVQSLESRVAALERLTGVNVHADTQRTNVCELLEEVRTKLSLTSEKGISSRLRKEAEEVSSVLKHQFYAMSVAEPLQLGAVLSKMEQWESIAATVPIVVARLRSLKRIHDEADGIVSAVQELGSKYETLMDTTSDNVQLLRNVRDNLADNLKAINENMALLEERLSSALEK